MKDLYEILEVDRNATADEIKQSYRRLAKKYHPDLNPGDHEAQEKFKEISSAYEVLGNEEKRRLYDTYGTTDTNAQFSGGFEDIFGDIFDIFGGTSSRRNAKAPRPGDDIRVDLTINLEDTLKDYEVEIDFEREVKCSSCNGTGAKDETKVKKCSNCNGTGTVYTVKNSFFGQVRTQHECGACRGKGVIIEEPCKHCHGTGRIKERVKKIITIPRGIQDGNYFSIGNIGNDGYNNGPRGEVYIVVNVLNKTGFKIENYNLIKYLEISFPEAALGNKRKIKTLDDTVEVVIPEGTQYDDVLKIPNKGLYRYNSNSRGDLYIVFKIKTPTKMTSKQRELLKDFTEGENLEEPPPVKSIINKIKFFIRRLFK